MQQDPRKAFALLIRGRPKAKHYRSLWAVIIDYADNGIIWPMEVAPYQVIIVPVNVLDEKVMSIAKDMYDRDI